MNPKNRNKIIILAVLGAAALFFVLKPLFVESEQDRIYRENMERSKQEAAAGVAPGADATGAAGTPAAAAAAQARSQFQRSAVDVDNLIASIREVGFNYDTDRTPSNPMTPLVGPTAPAAIAGAEGTDPEGSAVAMVRGDAQTVLRSFRVTGILWDKQDPMAVVTYPVKGELSSEVVTRGFTFPGLDIVVNDIEADRVTLNVDGSLVSLQLEER